MAALEVCAICCVKKKPVVFDNKYETHVRCRIKVIVGVWCIVAMWCDRCTCVVPTLPMNWTVCSTTSWRAESLSLSSHSCFLLLIPTGACADSNTRISSVVWSPLTFTLSFTLMICLLVELRRVLRCRLSQRRTSLTLPRVMSGEDLSMHAVSDMPLCQRMGIMAPFKSYAGFKRYSINYSNYLFLFLVIFVVELYF